MASLPNPNRLHVKILAWLRTTSHKPQTWRAGKLHRQVMACYSQALLRDRAGSGTQLGLSDSCHQPGPTLYSEQFRSLALSQPNTGHETKSRLEQLMLHMWFWHYKPSPLSNEFCFVSFVGLFCVRVCPFLIYFFLMILFPHIY